MANLTANMQPPVNPVYNGKLADWDLIERVLEFELPVDFKKLINQFGTGCFLKFLYPLSPFAPFWTSLNLLSGDTKQLLTAYEANRKEFPEYAPPFYAFPHEHGLFPWGITLNGDTLFWLRQGCPDKWPTVICDSKFSEEYDYFQLSATELLNGWIKNEIRSKLLPQITGNQQQVFIPFQEKQGSPTSI